MGRKIKRVLLIWPHNERKYDPDMRTDYAIESLRFPLGIGYLAAYLERELDIEVELLDMVAESPQPKIIGSHVRWGMRDEEIEPRIRQSQPDLVGVSQMFSYLEPGARKIFQIVKSIDPGIVTVWGGTHPTVAPKECVACPDADYIVLGEGEVAMRELIERLNAGESVDGMRSLAYRGPEDKPVINNNRSWIEDLDTHVLPARQKLDMTRYLGPTKTANLITSRGCPFACTFCTAPTMYQKRFNALSPECVVDELELLNKEYGACDFIIQDENTTLDMDRIEAVADEIIRRGLDINWISEVGVLIARLNRQLIHKLARSGFTELRLPVESGDAEILKKMKKPLKLSKVAPVLEAAREVDLKCVSFLLLGLPGESEENMRNTAEFALEMGFDWNVISLVLPLPGTQIYRDLVARGEHIDYVDLEKYASPRNGVSDILAERLVDLRVEFNDMLNFEQNYNLTRGNVTVAIDYFAELAYRYPGISKMHHYLGIAIYKSGDLEGALDSFRQAGEDNDRKLNSAEWATALHAFLEAAPSHGPCLSVDVEQKLGYAYGHIDPQAVGDGDRRPRTHRRGGHGAARYVDLQAKEHRVFEREDTIV